MLKRQVNRAKHGTRRMREGWSCYRTSESAGPKPHPLRSLITRETDLHGQINF